MILLLKFILAHLIGDFFLQTQSWIKEKEKKKWRSWKLLVHVLFHTILILLVIWWENEWMFWWVIPMIGISHWVIDACKLQFQNKKNKITWFVVDQLAHFAVLVVAWSLIKDVSLFFTVLESELFWISIVSVLWLTQPTAIIVKELISGWNPEKEEKAHSLENAGKYIGILERLFVFGCTVSGQWEGIGFLLAAKSVFRFGDLNEAKDRNLTEYVLIGTLISFGIAIITGLVFNEWKPQ